MDGMIEWARGQMNRAKAIWKEAWPFALWAFFLTGIPHFLIDRLTPGYIHAGSVLTKHPLLAAGNPLRQQFGRAP